MDLTKIELKDNEKRQIVLTWFGEEDREENIEICLIGDNSEVEVLGILFGKSNFKLNSSVKIIHKGKNTKANVLAHGIAMDKSYLDFSGMLRVENGARGTKTYFKANLMILSEQASAHTFPGLEIEENEIAQGGHAATVSKLNEEQMFYLMSRGLPNDVAKEIIVNGFFESVLNKIEDIDSQNLIRAKLLAR